MRATGHDEKRVICRPMIDIFDYRMCIPGCIEPVAAIKRLARHGHPPDVLTPDVADQNFTAARA
jgi:hypothetical protein